MQAESEAAAFERFRDAAQRGDHAGAIKYLYVWLDRIHPGRQAARLSTLVREVDDPELTRQADRLQATLFSPRGSASPTWSGRAFASGVARARNRRRLGSAARKDAAGSLGSLNPTAR